MSFLPSSGCKFLEEAISPTPPCVPQWANSKVSCVQSIKLCSLTWPVPRRLWVKWGRTVSRWASPIHTSRQDATFCHLPTSGLYIHRRNTCLTQVMCYFVYVYMLNCSFSCLLCFSEWPLSTYWALRQGAESLPNVFSHPTAKHPPSPVSFTC